MVVVGADVHNRTHTLAPTLLTMPGVGPLSAAKLVGVAAGMARSKSGAARGDSSESS